MKITLLCILAWVSILCANRLYAQVQTLNHIGQTPGGAAHHVHWIENQNLLIVGCGGSLWVYDMSDPQNPEVIKKRVFKQLINHTDLFGDTLFVAATNEGVYALNFNSDSLDIIANYMPTGAWARDVFDFYRNQDTLYIPDKYEVKVVKYSAGNFQHLSTHTNSIVIGDNMLNVKAGARCIDINDNYMVVGKIQDPFNQGRVSIYNRHYPYQRLAFWEDSTLNNIQKVRFADLRNDIIYVCAGSNNAGFSSQFYACQYDGSNLFPVDTFAIEGLPMVAAVNITNMTSRNDTIYLATTCWIDPVNATPAYPFSFIPVLDASKLPLQPMTYETYFYAGLWHFDVELMKGTPYMAIASEWAGLILTNISNPNNHLDTLSVIETGGWVQEVKVKGDTAFVAHEGWGLAAYLADSLLFEHGLNTDAIILHEYILHPGHYFVSGFEFIDDTLLYMTNGRVLNMRPWYDGNDPVLIDTLNYTVPAAKIEKIKADNGTRMVIGSGIWPAIELKISLHNPQTGLLLDEIITNNEPKAYAIQDSVIFYAYRTTPYLQTGDVHLVAAKIINDQFYTICDHVVKSATLDVLTSIAVENNIVVVGCGASFIWYEWTNDVFSQSGVFTHTNTAMGTSGVDIKNNIIYGNYRYDGLKVIDINGTELAYFKGSGGYNGIAGSGCSEVLVGDNGRIYISDFYSGLFVVEVYDLSLNNQEQILEGNNSLFSIFPNPAQHHVTIQLRDDYNFENMYIKIIDIAGKECFKQKLLPKVDIQIDTEKWNAGLYIVNIIGQNKTIFSDKLIIQ